MTKWTEAWIFALVFAVADAQAPDSSFGKRLAIVAGIAATACFFRAIDYTVERLKARKQR